MSGAGVESVPEDFDGAHELLAKAREHIEDAQHSHNHASSRFLLGYQASLDIMNAVLKGAGRRITSGFGGHMKRIEVCQQLMPDHAELFERIDDARQRRNKITYDGAAPDEDVVEELTDDIEKLAEKAAGYIDLAHLAYHAEFEEEFRGGE